MGIGIGIVLLTIGAVLVWAVEASFEAIDLDVVGVILMITGGIGLLWGLLASNLRGHNTVIEE
ncbi:MAG: hypothetical protein KY439_05455 [Actinobacteria bacterium]|nr:hypothetical protein [Actinomycetota bacterium]